MPSRHSWVEGLLLPASHYRVFVERRLANRSLTPECREALESHSSARRRALWVERVLLGVERSRGAVLTPEDPGYPRRLLELHQPPPALFVRGDADLLRRADAVAVVGARRASPASRRAAEILGGDLALRGVPVLSGLARGVDSASHRGCVRHGGKPIAVLGTALDTVYPTQHAELQEEIAHRGCLVTEVPPGEGPRPWRFLARNRILAALARAVVVIQAAARSGSLSTVEFASELEHPVLVYPGAFDDPEFEGSLALLRQGHLLVGDSAQVLEELGVGEAAVAPPAPLGLDRPRSPDEIARLQGMELGRVLAELAELELEGRVERVEGGRYLARARSGGT